MRFRRTGAVYAMPIDPFVQSRIEAHTIRARTPSSKWFWPGLFVAGMPVRLRFPHRYFNRPGGSWDVKKGLCVCMECADFNRRALLKGVGLAALATLAACTPQSAVEDLPGPYNDHLGDLGGAVVSPPVKP